MNNQFPIDTIISQASYFSRWRFWFTSRGPDNSPRLIIQNLSDDESEFIQQIKELSEETSILTREHVGLARLGHAGEIRLQSTAPEGTILLSIAQLVRESPPSSPLRRLIGATYQEVSDSDSRPVSRNDLLWRSFVPLSQCSVSAWTLLSETAQTLMYLQPGDKVRFWLAAPVIGTIPLLMLHPANDTEGFSFRIAKLHAHIPLKQESVGVIRCGRDEALQIELYSHPEQALPLLAHLLRQALPALPGLGRLSGAALDYRDASKERHTLGVLPSREALTEFAVLAALQQALHRREAYRSRFFFWFSATGPHLILAPAGTDLSAQVESLLGAEALTDPSAVQGKVSASDEDQLFRFQAAQAAPGFLASVATLVRQHAAQIPELQLLKNARFRAQDADGQTLDIQKDSTLWEGL